MNMPTNSIKGQEAATRIFANSTAEYTTLKRRINGVEDVNVRTRMVEELHEKQKLILTMPSGNDMDVNFPRLKYGAMPDDFLIGVIGTKNECETIKADITKFMQEKLRLEMSQEKTLITNAKTAQNFWVTKYMSVKTMPQRETVTEQCADTSTGM